MLRTESIAFCHGGQNCLSIHVLPTNWLYNFVRCQKLKYFGHVTRHNGLEKTIMQGMVAGKRSR